MAERGNALIAGAGIGGLTAAICLERHGWQVDVFEAATEIAEVGAGLQLSPNAMKVLRQVGLDERVIGAGFQPEALELRLGRSGQQVFSIPVADKASALWGAPYVHIHRADLLDILAAAATEAGVRVHTSAAVTGYRAAEACTALHLADGTGREGDLIVGADGLHSAIRRQMLGDTPARFTGNMAWRATVPIERLDNPPPPTACVWAGPGRHAVTYRLRGGRLANFVGVVERPDWTREAWSDEGTRAEVLADFAGWHPVITELIDKADRHLRWGLYDRPPLPHWSDGAAVLLGDACHPMLPFQAQGAAQAIEDAFVLARDVSTNSTVPDGLARYEATRKPRTASIQAASRANMKTFHRRSPLSQLATYGPMKAAGLLLPGIVRSRLDWIFAHDVTLTDR